MTTKHSKLHNAIFKKITRPKVELLLQKYATAKKTLDIGSSHAPYKKHFPNSVCLDLKAGRNVDVVADAHCLPFTAASFEVVLMTHVLDDCFYPHLVATEIARVLKPGGTVIMVVPFIYPINDGPYDYWRFTPYALRELFPGYKEIEIIPVLRQIETIALIFQRLAYQACGSKAKRLFFGLLAWFLNRINLDRLIEQSGYATIGRQSETKVDNLITALYLGVFRSALSKKVVQGS